MSEITVHTQLRRNALGVAGIVFLVLAAVAPLTGIVVVASLVIALGNGGGAPASFFIVAAVLLLFAVGYAQMSKQLVSAGGFYAFVVKGLGRTGGLVAGFIATLGYNFFVVGTIGTSGFFMQIVIADLTGFNLHWYVWGLASIIVSFVMARQGVDFSSKVLGVSLVLETLILVVFDISVLVQTGFDVSAFSPEAVFSGSLPIGLLLAATGFLGFEATALFSEEAKDPLRTVPRATYIAITSIGVILGVTTWAVVSATGVAQAQQTALDHLPTGDLIFSLSQQYLGYGDDRPHDGPAARQPLRGDARVPQLGHPLPLRARSGEGAAHRARPYPGEGRPAGRGYRAGDLRGGRRRVCSHSPASIRSPRWCRACSVSAR